MRELGITLKAVPSTIGWDGLFRMTRTAKQTSALFAAANPELAPWAAPLKLMQVLTDLYDLVAVLDWHVVSMFSKGRRRRPKPYPRPWVDDGSEMHLGKGAIAIADFDDWYYAEDSED